MSSVPITRDELAAWGRYVHEICGVSLDGSKGYLFETRLGVLMRETQSGGFAELLHKTRRDATNALRRKVIDAMTTNETSFFRDRAPFDLLRHKLVPELVDRRGKTGLRPVPIRILSAACSTGQEAYSTAIVLKETLGELRNYDARILGLDISDQAVARASHGHFTRLEIDRGLTAADIARHFEPAGDRWKVKDELRATALFRRANLLETLVTPPFFDIIFCRNVAIYFTEPDRIRLFRTLGRALAPGGALIIGSTESLSGICPEFEPRRHLRAVFYRKKESPP